MIICHPLLLASLVGVLALQGCKDPYQMRAVSGRVLTCEGKPAVGGTIVFSPMDEPKVTGRPPGYPGTESYGRIDEQGEFRLEPSTGQAHRSGAVSGRHRVSFWMPLTETPQPSEEDASMMSQAEFEAYVESLREVPLFPVIPCSDRVSPSTVTVPEEGARFDFVLEPLAPGEKIPNSRESAGLSD